MHFRIIRVTWGGGNRRVSNAAGVLLSYHQMPYFSSLDEYCYARIVIWDSCCCLARIVMMLLYRPKEEN